MRIGILTLFHGNNNWGGNLQGYALKTYIEEHYKGSQVDLIYYKSSANVIYKNKLEQMAQYGPLEALEKIKEKVIKKKTPADAALKKRKALFEGFQNAYLSNDHVYRDEELQELADEYDCLICGSDQIWNPNVSRPGYYLKNVAGTRGISYAASIARDTLSEKEASEMVPLIDKFDFVSVREKTAKAILDYHFQGKKQIYEVLDPALLRTKEQWSDFIGPEKYENSPYALMFFFSDSAEYRQNIERFCQNNGLKLIGIPHAATYIKNDEEGNYEKAYDVGPIEFLRLFRDASYVFTDSFHGSAFSIVFEKQFCVFERDKNTKVSKNSRLYDLLDKFKLSDRLIKSADSFDSRCNSRIDYEAVNEILVRERTSSAEFLENALANVHAKEKKVIQTVADFEKKSCCGCGACAQICPRKCIALVPDAEGYLYPSINKELCIACGKCVRSCVQRQPKRNAEHTPETFIGYNSAEDIRKDSSSGGLFFPIARAFIINGGVVYGAAFTKDFSVKHIRIDKEENLSAIMRSKYVQSNLTDVLDTLIADLKHGKKVLFSGTPCQTAAICHIADTMGLRDNLYGLDFICHGVPSPMLWKSYLDFISGKKQICDVNFRDKKHAGWHDYFLHIGYEDKSHLSESHELNTYMRLFLSDKAIRPSCYYCQFKAENYASDLTLGDAWKIEKEYPAWADDKGTSLFIVRSNNGRTLLDSCKDEILCRASDYSFWAKMNPSMVTRTQVGNGRKAMFADFAQMPPEAFWVKYGHIPAKKKARYFAKKALKVTGLEKVVRNRM